MQRLLEPQMNWPARSAAAVLSGAWLWMFLHPLEQLSLLLNAQTLWPVFVALVVAQWLPWWTLRILTAIAASTGYIAYYFHAENTGWLAAVLQLYRVEWVGVLRWLHTGALLDPLQTHVFLLSLTCVYWLVVYASARVQLWLFYNVLAIGVLAVVDLKTTVHPDQAIVVVTVIAALVLGLTQFWRWRALGVSTRRLVLRYFLPLACLISVSGTVAWAMPKPSTGPDTGRKWQFGHPSAGANTPMVIGYQPDDSHLGGSFQMNYDPVLRVTTPLPIYLQGQVLDEYTGHGWISGTTHEVPVRNGQVLVPATPDLGLTTPVVTVSQTVQVLSDSLQANVLFGAFSVQQLFPVVSGTAPQDVRFDQVSSTLRAAWSRAGDAYQVVSVEPTDPAPRLQQLPSLGPDPLPRYPSAIQLADLQLPASLPARVRQLASQITRQSRNEYDAVMRVQAYLRSHERYAIAGVPVPGPGQDYVDQFLFDTHRGYCNNFSSSMAVLLRSVGIPTRWVTGFTEGTLDATWHGNGFQYIVRNSDAHAWVEVYFPHEGWVPFDPTPDFVFPYAPESSQPLAINQLHRQTQLPAASQPVKHARTGQLSGVASLEGWIGAGGKRWGNIVGMTLAVAVAALLLMFRRRLALTRHLAVWTGLTESSLTRAMHHLRRQLQRRYGLIEELTLRDLSALAATYDIDGADFRHLVRTAEGIWYGGEHPSPSELQRARSTWRTWMVAIVYHAHPRSGRQPGASGVHPGSIDGEDADK